MLQTIVIALALSVASYGIASAESACPTRLAGSAVCPVAPAEAELARLKVVDVLCCCRTHTGGECCTRVAACGGKPPGCFCASPSVPPPRFSSFARAP
jgi:hypothetical protein